MPWPWIRSLAELRGRNADWAEKAVREAATLNARQALEQHVIELVAPDVTELLRAVNGRKVVQAGRNARFGRTASRWCTSSQIS